MKNITNKYLEEPIYNQNTHMGSIVEPLKKVFNLEVSTWELSNLENGISGWRSSTFWDNGTSGKVRADLYERINKRR